MSSSSGQINRDSQKVSQSYQPEEGAYDDEDQPKPYSRASSERPDRSSEDVTEAPEEA